MIALPDVNVLVAAMWPEHVMHAAAARWLDEHADAGWATCSITELGFIRVSSNRRAVGDAVLPAAAAAALRELRVVGDHRFWEDDVQPSAADSPLIGRIVGHRQTTDAHLVELARRHGGYLASFDRGLEHIAGGDLASAVRVIG